MSALTDVQAAHATSAAAMAVIKAAAAYSIDTPIEAAKVLLAYSVARAVVVAALTASATAQAAVAAAHVALNAVLTSVTTVTPDTPYEKLKDALTAFATASVAIAALT